MRTDLSATLFLSAPESYAGGELVVNDTYGQHAVKLPAGDTVLYPSSSLHCVTPVTSGIRVASFLWIQSMIRDDKRRSMLFELDGNIQKLKAATAKATKCCLCLICTITCCANGQRSEPCLLIFTPIFSILKRDEIAR